MSAHETFFGHRASSSAFASSIILKPLKLGLLILFAFSAGFPGVESSKIEASQP